MLRTRHTDQQKARILRDFEHTDQSAAAFCRQHGVSYQTLMNWRSSAAANSPSRNHHPHSSSSNSEPHASGPLVELELGGAIVLHYLSNPLCPAMIFTHSVKVCLATRPCDLRKSFDTLSIVGHKRPVLLTYSDILKIRESMETERLIRISTYRLVRCFRARTKR